MATDNNCCKKPYVILQAQGIMPSEDAEPDVWQWDDFDNLQWDDGGDVEI